MHDLLGQVIKHNIAQYQAGQYCEEFLTGFFIWLCVTNTAYLSGVN